MAKNIVRLDIVEGNPRSFVAPQDLENGYFLEITGKAGNAYLDVEDDYEAYEVKLATATTERGDLLFHKSVENMYDERLQKMDFVLEEGKVGRGYQLIMGDIITIPVVMCGATVSEDLTVTGLAVGDKVKLGAGGKLAKATTGDTAIGKVEAIEEIVIPLYGGQWGSDTNVSDVIQVSAVIKINN